MNPILFLLSLAAFVGVISAVVCLLIAFGEADWSLAVLRAKRQRVRMVNERLVAFMALGHDFHTARRLADVELCTEAMRNQKAIEQVLQ